MKHNQIDNMLWNEIGSDRLNEIEIEFELQTTFWYENTSLCRDCDDFRNALREILKNGVL